MEIAVEIVDLTKIMPSETDCLDGAESVLFEKFRFEKRRNDWLGGRLAAKQLALKTLFKDCALSLKDIRVLSDRSGRPYLNAPGAPHLPAGRIPLSISHSGQFAVAAIGLRNCSLLGVDLEKIETRPGSWIEQAFHPSELNIGGEQEYLTELWTKKEAVLKALGIGLSCDLWDVRFQGNSPIFYSTAKMAWEQLGQPEFEVISNPDPEGYYFSVACAYCGGAEEQKNG